jgi:hypothetical protein
MRQPEHTNNTTKFLAALSHMLFATLGAFPTQAVAAQTITAVAPSQAEHSVIGYINAYRYHDFVAVGRFDAAISAAIDKRFKRLPQENNLAEAERPELAAMHRSEKDKLAGTATDPFGNPERPTPALRPLHQALYPEIRFKIIAARDGDKGRDKKVVVELNYADSAHAPRHNGKPVSSARIHVMLRAGQGAPEYKVEGYRLTGQGIRYF